MLIIMGFKIVQNLINSKLQILYEKISAIEERDSHSIELQNLIGKSEAIEKSSD